MEVRGEAGYIPIAIYCHHQNESCIKMGSDERHKATDQKFKEKGEPKRIRTEVPLLTSLTPYR